MSQDSYSSGEQSTLLSRATSSISLANMSQTEDYLSAQLTRFKSINTIIGQIMDPTAHCLAASAVLSRMEYLQSLWTQCGDTHVTIEQVASKEERLTLPYFTEQHFSTLELLVLDAIGAAKEFVYGAPMTSASNSHPTIQLASFAHDGTQRESNLVKVPRIQLPRFSGSYTEWPSFAEYFNSLVKSMHHNDLERLHYLKACLDGEAAALVRNIPITAKTLM